MTNIMLMCKLDIFFYNIHPFFIQQFCLRHWLQIANKAIEAPVLCLADGADESLRVARYAADWSDRLKSYQ